MSKRRHFGAYPPRNSPEPGAMPSLPSLGMSRPLSDREDRAEKLQEKLALRQRRVRRNGDGTLDRDLNGPWD